MVGVEVVLFVVTGSGQVHVGDVSAEAVSGGIGVVGGDATMIPGGVSGVGPDDIISDIGVGTGVNTIAGGISVDDVSLGSVDGGDTNMITGAGVGGSGINIITGGVGVGPDMISGVNGGGTYVIIGGVSVGGGGSRTIPGVLFILTLFLVLVLVLTMVVLT